MAREYNKGRLKVKKKFIPYILLAPSVFIIALITIVGFSSALIQSLGYFPPAELYNFSFKYYRAIFEKKDFLLSLKFSIYISFVSSIVATVVGVLVGYAIIKSRYENKLVQFIYKAPIVVPHTIVALLIFNIFYGSGLIARLFYNLGIISTIDNFPILVMDKQGIGIMAVYLWKEIPFVAMIVYSILCNINDKLTEVAVNLGASSRQVFFHILLPLSLPTIFTTFITVFAFSFGSYEVPYLIGATSPNALSVSAFLKYTSSDLGDRPYAMVESVILTVISFVLIGFYEKGYKRLSKGGIYEKK